MELLVLVATFVVDLTPLLFIAVILVYTFFPFRTS